MNYNEEKEKQYVNEIMNILCNVTDNILNSNNLNIIKNKQKMYAIASFLEFIKAGADVTTETIDSNTISFIINMK